MKTNSKSKKNNLALVLGIETSCDETAVAIYHAERGLLANHIYSQIDLHRAYDGVVPELASRDHIRKILPLIEALLKAAGVSVKDIDGIAYTKGPGLIGSLMVGATIAHSLAFAWNIPVLGVHHMEAHLMAVMLEEKTPEYPFLALIVSGGHTMLVHVNDFGDYCLLGETLDDAVGEAFDKTGSLLGLSYPGGPALAKLAEQGNASRFHFPRPMVNRPGLEFSFSGLKTSVLNCVKQHEQDDQTRADIACAFEDAVVDTLRIKCQRALKQTHLDCLVVAGGVSANKKLRHTLQKVMRADGVEVFYPRSEFCTDNAAMVAYTGFQRLAQGERSELSIEVKARWKITDTKSS